MSKDTLLKHHYAKHHSFYVYQPKNQFNSAHDKLINTCIFLKFSKVSRVLHLTSSFHPALIPQGPHLSHTSQIYKYLNPCHTE